jgi:predicted nucleic acid-binding protein
LRSKIDGKIDSLKETLKRLKDTGFWVSDKLEARLLMETGESV